MKPILVLFLIALPLVLAATLPDEELTEEEIEKRMSLGTIVTLLKTLDLSDGCINVCEKHVGGWWRYLCDGACTMLLG